MSKRSRLSVLLLSGVLAAAVACHALVLPAPALAVSDDPVLKNMDAVLEENARLKEEAWKLRKSGDREASRQAAEALDASEERVERTRVEALAHVAGVSPAQVEALRKDGKSWGQASGELGVHPGFLGIGKTPLYESRPVRKAKSAKVSSRKGKRGQKAVVGKTKAPASEVKADKKQARKADKAKPRSKRKRK